MRKPLRASKIVCTLGPATASVQALVKLTQAGMDIARVNFSHGSHEDHAKLIANVREASSQLGIPVGILADLQGPKIRTGKLKEKSIELKPGQTLFFRGIAPNAKQIPADGSKESPVEISYPRLCQDLHAKDQILVEDGMIRMRVRQCFPQENLLEAEVEIGKKLGENKGVNMPGARLSGLGVTEKDWADVLFGIEQDVDFFALSFVRSSKEVRYLKDYLKDKSQGTHVIAKIEKGEAIDDLEDIVQASDGVMVARGDLGVEVGNEHVPLLQKKIIRTAQKYAKPVITATQMLMSMVENPTPSRAEASDVANAVLDGSDALMLSNETSVGQYATQSVETMHNIICGAEGFKPAKINVLKIMESVSKGSVDVGEAIESSATVLAAALDARNIACLTRSGQSARLLSKMRPDRPIFAFVENPKVRNQLCLSWGVSVIPWKEMHQQDYTIFDELLEELDRLGLLSLGDIAVMTAGIPTTQKIGTTNTVVVRELTRHVQERVKRR